MSEKNVNETGVEKPTLEQLIEKSRELKEESKKTVANLAELQQDSKEFLTESKPDQSKDAQNF